VYLDWKKALVRFQSNPGASFHRFGEQESTQIAGQNRRNGFFEEQPNMAALAGTGALYSCGDLLA